MSEPFTPEQEARIRSIVRTEINRAAPAAAAICLGEHGSVKIIEARAESSLPRALEENRL